MPHMETFMAAVLGKGLGSRIALVSDRRFLWCDWRPGHRPRQPRGLRRRNLALLRNGDMVHIDIEARADCGSKRLRNSTPARPCGNLW